MKRRALIAFWTVATLAVRWETRLACTAIAALALGIYALDHDHSLWIAPFLIPVAAAVGAAAAGSAIASSASIILVLGATGRAEPCVAAPLGGIFSHREPEPPPPETTLCGIGRSVVAPNYVDPSLSSRLARMLDRTALGRRIARGMGHLGDVRDRLLIERVAHLGPAAGLPFASHGSCLAGLTGVGDVLWFSEAEMIVPGDLTMFRVAGDPLTRIKVYVGMLREGLGTRRLFGDAPGPILCWWQWNPPSLVVAPRGDVVAHLCATHIWRPSSGEAERDGARRVCRRADAVGGIKSPRPRRARAEAAA